MIGKYLTISEDDFHNYDGDIASIIKVESLGLCGCGTDDCLWLIKEILEEKVKYLEKTNINVYDSKLFNEIYNVYKDKLRSIIEKRKDAVIEFIFYWLDNKNFIEHGTSIGSAWLEKKGEDLLHDLRLLEKEVEEK